MQATEKAVQLVEQHSKRKRSNFECDTVHIDTQQSVHLATASTKQIINGSEPCRLVTLTPYQIGTAKDNADTPINTFVRESQMAHPFCLFEKGSTLCAPNEQNNIPSETPKGAKKQHKNTLCIDQLRTLYIPLEQVSRCKFCNAIKLQYESEGFCCSDGSVKLVSQKLPMELRNLYFGNNEESKHFRTYIRTYNNMFAFTFSWCALR